MKIQLAVVFLGLVALASATRVSVKDRQIIDALSRVRLANRAFGDELRALLETLRELMLAGDEEQGIPVLDPYQREGLDVSFDIPSTASGELSVRDLKVEGLAGFVVDNVDFNILRLRLDFDINFPSIKASLGQYSLWAKLLGYTFFGEGDGSIELVNLRLHGFATVTIQGGFLHMNNFQIAFELESCNSNISGILGGGAISDVINQVIETLLPALVESQGDLISGAVAGFVIDFANQFLNELTLADLIDIITGGGGGGGESRVNTLRLN